MHKFYGTPHDSVEGFREGISGAYESGYKGSGAFQGALVSLVGLRDRIAATDCKDDALLEQFRKESCEKLIERLEFRKKIMSYAGITLDMAEIAEEGDWYRLCMRRSILQILLEDYAGMPVSELVNLEHVEELDEELHRVGLEQDPVSEENIPCGLPESHWWWRYPSHKHH